MLKRFLAVLAAVIVLGTQFVAPLPAVAQEGSGSKLPIYGFVEPSGTTERNGMVQVRLDLCLDEGAYRYNDERFYVIDQSSPEYQAGYQGELDKEGYPVDEVAYEKWHESLPRKWAEHRIFHHHFIYIDPYTKNWEAEIEAALQLHLPNFYQAWTEDLDQVKHGMRHGWDVETRTRPTRYDTEKSNDARKQDSLDLVSTIKQSHLSIQSTSGDGETFPATWIEVGAEAVNHSGVRTLYYNDVNILVNQGGDASNASGVIDTVEVYFDRADSGHNFRVGIVEDTGTPRFTCRDIEGIGTVSTGKVTLTGLDLDIETGDYIAADGKGSTGTLRIDTDSSSGTVYQSEDNYLVVDSEVYYDSYTGTMSLYGTGGDPEPVVTTQAASSVEDTTATGNGNITSVGKEDCTKRGFVYGTTSITVGAEKTAESLSLEDSESFESNLGDWSNDANNVSDWIRDSGGTPSWNTGPSSAQSGSYYIYVETSSGDSYSDGDTDIIEYDIGSSKDGYVDFYYHQYGDDQGTLSLEGYDGSSWSEIWSSSGNQGNQWNHVEQASTEFTSYSKLRFKNIAAGGWQGDVALDLIKVYTGTLAEYYDIDDYDEKVEDTGTYSTGAFTKSLSSLSSYTTYYIRAIAYNSEGYGWGDEVSFTTDPTLDVSTSPSNYDAGTQELSSTIETGLDYFTITNSSDCTVDVTIGGSDFTGTGTDWTLSDTATPGSDTAGLKAGLSGGDYTIVVKKSTPYNTLKSGLAASATQDFGLKIYMPTEVSDNNEKTSTVTITIVEA